LNNTKKDFKETRIEVENGCVKFIDAYETPSGLNIAVNLERPSFYKVFPLPRLVKKGKVLKPYRLVLDIEKPPTREHLDNIIDIPAYITQGNIDWIRITDPKEAVDSIEGKFLGNSLDFFRLANGDFMALIWVGLNESLRSSQLWIRINYKDGQSKEIKEEIKIRRGIFRLQRLRLPEYMVTLSKENLLRVERENKRLKKIWQILTPKRYWQGSFVMPVEGCISSEFGTRRILNGKPRSPHTGIDIAAPYGEEIIATNHGKVVFVGELFFGGKAVIIDHGLGLYSIYFHLSKFAVEEGGFIKKGQLLGFVGSTGRATSPHLHFGVKLKGSSVNPVCLFYLPCK
jgi:murein DD-endopeptidase MepM/ murein hydrolase activator NlpD